MSIPTATIDARLPVAPPTLPTPGFVPLMPGSVPGTVPPSPIPTYGVSPFGIPLNGMPLGTMPQAPMPGLMPPLAPVPAFGTPLGAPLAPIPPYGVSPFGVAPYGMSPAPIAPFGMPLTPVSPWGVPPAPIPAFGMPLSTMAPAPIHPYGVSPWGGFPHGMALGVPPAPMSPINPYGIAPFGTPLGAIPQVPMPGIVPPAPNYPYGGASFGTQLGMPLGAMPQAPIPAFGTQLGVPPAPIGPTHPYGGLPPLSPSATVVPFLVSQIALREAANRLGDDAIKGRVITGANEAIDRTIEDVAGVTLPPWMKTVAPAWVYSTAVDLALLAHSYPEGPMRAELLNVAGQILSKGLAPMGEGQGGGGHRR